MPYVSLCLCISLSLSLAAALSATIPVQPLSVQLGPGILGNIFDGIQRPLKTIAQRSGDVFIPRGVAVPALDETKSWEFAPTGFKVCAHSAGKHAAPAEAALGASAASCCLHCCHSAAHNLAAT
jgi:hypothetical protein